MPEKAQPQIVIVNITPLIAVNLIGQLNLRVPEAVWKEIEAGEQIGLDIRELKNGKNIWIHVEKVKDMEILKYLVE